jgi:hypothetical protein
MLLNASTLASSSDLGQSRPVESLTPIAQAGQSSMT